MSTVEQQLEAQRVANTSGLPHFEAFQGHRAELTQLILGSAAAGPETLCVLGAGNAYDLELEALLDRFAHVHLADIDADAVARARQRAPEAARSRLLTHAPLELSGMFHELERWGRLQVTPQELAMAPATGAKRVAGALPGPFDVVVSSCLLTQLQLSLLRVIGDQHPLFVVLRELLSLTHLRTLAALTRPGGRALLVTDLCEAAAFPAGLPREPSDLTGLMNELVASGHVVHSSHPGVLERTLTSDPPLSRAFGRPTPSEPWLWHNGPERLFLVYGLTLQRTSA
ncbi:MAG TPA: hypothetical protein VER04_02325 [Polyangiaceae bacterium]|nr:hypothetical protein [Polyangiaceae bacterium]